MCAPSCYSWSGRPPLSRRPTAAIASSLLALTPAQACCTELLTADAPSTLLALLATSDRPSVRQTVIKALRRLQQADALEFDAALSASPDLEAALLGGGGHS